MAIIRSTVLGGDETPVAVTISHDPTTTATDAPQGSLILDANGGWWRKRDNGSSTNVDKITDPTELTELMPIPEGRTGGNGSFAAPLTLAGAAYVVNRRCLMNRLIFRVTAGGGVTSLARFLLYQAADGASRDPSTNLVSLIGQVTGFNASATGNFAAAFDAGATVDVQRGLLYVLWGRESGTAFTLRSYLTQAMDLQNANVDLDTHPSQFTTTIAANAVTPAATFDPRQAPTGAATGTSASDAALAFRLKKL